MRTQRVPASSSFGMKVKIAPETFENVRSKLVIENRDDLSIRENAVSIQSVNKGMSIVQRNIDSIFEKLFKQQLSISAKKSIKDYKAFLKEVSSKDSLHAKSLIPDYENAEVTIGLDAEPSFNSGMTVVVKIGEDVVDSYYGLGQKIDTKDLVRGIVGSLRELTKPLFAPKIEAAVKSYKTLERSDKGDLDSALAILKQASETGHF